MANFVAYYRVSTTAQGQSGLGLDAQKESVHAYIKSVGGSLVSEYREVESGALAERVEMRAALKLCRAQKAMLVIAKLDRLARSVHFISELLESGVEFVAADMPHANKLTIHIIAAVAEHEREVIAQRTRASLAAAKARGVRLGNPNAAQQSWLAALETKKQADAFASRLAPIINAHRNDGLDSYSKLAAALDKQGVQTQRGGSWTAAGVRNIVKRLEGIDASPDGSSLVLP